MYCYVYIIYSIRYNFYYIGSSFNPTERLKEHNGGKVKSTKNKGPWILKFYQDYQNQKQARQIEYKLKKLKRRDIIERIIIEGRIKININ